MVTKKKDPEMTLEIVPVQTGSLTLCIKGSSPLILHRLAQKALHELLFPKGGSKAGARAGLKHDPWAEFRDSAHTYDDEAAPTLLALPSTAFKGAVRNAALDVGGSNKAQIGRLTFVADDFIPVWGVPEILLSAVRNSDPKRTPDVRTRVIVRHWATVATIHYAQPQLRQQSVLDLVTAAGVIMGVGDWRPEKGSGSYGRFEVCNPDDPEFLQIQASGERAQQVAAMAAPTAFNAETGELLAWFDQELQRRGYKGEPKPEAPGNGATAPTPRRVRRSPNLNA